MSSQSSIGDSDKENSTPSVNRDLEVLRTKKRVIFSPLPALLLPSADSTPDSLKIPRKSVLKAPTLSPASSPIIERADPTKSDLLCMIEAAIQSLRGSDRASKLETYTTLSNLFRAFENVPDRAQLFPRLTELFGLIFADMTRHDAEEPDRPDVPLNTKALKLAGFMLFDVEISAGIPPKIARSLIEHSLSRMEAEVVSKATSTQFLWLWQTQHLPKTVITAELAERILLAAMRANFPSVIVNQERMSVLLRLLDQNRDCMIKNVDAWLPRVITYMLDDNKAIRTAALRTALVAGKHFCKVPSVGRCVQNFLKTEIDNKPFIDLTSQRFKSIMQEPEGGIYVAHAWGSICTLSSSQNPEKSKTLMAWMHVLQVVFNSHATENKVMAQSAWVRMVHYFGNNGDIIYREKNISYLTKPMSRMLSKDVRVYDTVRMAAVNTVCSLLYVLLKPDVSSEQISQVWAGVIEPIIVQMLEPFQKEALHQTAIDILVALFESKPLEPWTLDRLLDSSVGTPHEIHHLDHRWVKAHAGLIVQVMTIALQSHASRESKLKLWTLIQKSIKAASAKEIQISAETMEATAALCTILQNLWTAPIPAISSPSNRKVEDPSKRASFVSSLVLATFKEFGTSTFTEKSLAFSDGSAITPLQSPSKSDAAGEGSGCGLKFLFNLFQHPIASVVVSEDYIDCLEVITTAAISGQKSLRKCLNLLSQCIGCISQEKKEIPVQSWKVLAQIAYLQLGAETAKMAGPSPSSTPLHDTDETWSVIKNILAFGIQIQHGAEYEEWLQLARGLAAATRKSRGDFAMNQVVVEPLSAMLLEAGCLQEGYVRLIMKMAAFQEGPSSSRVGLSEKASLGAQNKVTTKFELDQTCDLIGRSLAHLATVWRKYRLTEEALTVLDEMADFMDRIPQRMTLDVLFIVQEGLLAWSDRSLDGPEKLFIASLGLIARGSRSSSDVLMRLSPLVCDSFRSDNINIATKMAAVWNATFGSQPRLDYPQEVLDTIDGLDLEPGHLTLPTWPRQDPEVQQDAHGDAVGLALPTPPKMKQLEKSVVSPRTRKRGTPKEASADKSRSESAPDKVTENEARTGKRKRVHRTSSTVLSTPNSSPAPAPATKSDMDAQVIIPVPVTSTPRRKRQKRSQTSEAGSPSKLPDDGQDSRDHGSDAPQIIAESVFTLRKRELRERSPQIMSDPISESSPSVYSRIRKESNSHERPVMEALRQSSRSLSSPSRRALLIHQDELNLFEGLSAEDDFPEPDRLTDLRIVNSDDLMQLQILNESEESVLRVEQEQVEADQPEESTTDEGTTDEDLFILQLQQYRNSLQEGRPVTPRRKARLGLLIKEITKLSGDVTEAYFDD